MPCIAASIHRATVQPTNFVTVTLSCPLTLATLHVTAPDSTPDHFGTLIICLPSPFQGGELVLRHIDHNSSTAPSTKTYDWSSPDGSMPQALQWAAFYADTGVCHTWGCAELSVQSVWLLLTEVQRWSDSA